MVRLTAQSTASLPQQLSPMLAQPCTRLPDDDGWGYEFKWDGIRALAAIDDNRLSLVGRNGSVLTTQFPELHGMAELSLPQPLILDGEVIVMHNDKADFGRIQPRLHQRHRGRIAQIAHRQPATYIIFDLLWRNGKSFMNQSLRTRRDQLDALELADRNWSMSPITSVDPQSVVAIASKHEMEGVIAKRWDSRYEPGARSGAWLKYRITAAQEFVVGGWRASSADHSDVGALALGYHRHVDDPALVFAGFVGSGFSQWDHRALLPLLHERRQPYSPFVQSLPLDDVQFVEPTLVVQVRFAQWTAKDILRHASYQGLREDKPAREVVRET